MISRVTDFSLDISRRSFFFTMEAVTVRFARILKANYGKPVLCISITWAKTWKRVRTYGVFVPISLRHAALIWHHFSKRISVRGRTGHVIICKND